MMGTPSFNRTLRHVVHLPKSLFRTGFTTPRPDTAHLSAVVLFNQPVAPHAFCLVQMVGADAPNTLMQMPNVISHIKAVMFIRVLPFPSAGAARPQPAVSTGKLAVVTSYRQLAGG